MLWVTALGKVLSNRRAAFRLSRKNYLRNQRYRIFRFRQTQRFLAIVGITVCGLIRVCGIFRYRSVWVRELSSDWWHRAVNRTWTAGDWRKNFRMCKETFNHFAMSLLLKYLGKIQDFGELYLRAKGLLLHYGGLPQMLSIEQSATYLALEDLRLVLLCTMFLKPSFKLFFQYTFNCPKESALMKLCRILPFTVLAKVELFSHPTKLKS